MIPFPDKKYQIIEENALAVNSTGEGGREYRKGKQEHNVRAGMDAETEA